MSELVGIGAVGVGVIAVVTLAYPLRVAVQSKGPSARPFAAVLGAHLLWAVCATVPQVPGLPTVVISSWLWEVGSDLGALGVPLTWLVYTRTYAGRKEWQTPGMIGLTILAVCFLVVTHLPTAGETVVSVVAGIIIFSMLIAAAVVFCYGTWLLYRVADTHARVSPWQVLTVLAIVITPFVINIAIGMWAFAQFVLTEAPTDQTIAAVPISDLPIGFLIAGVCATVVVRRYPVLGGFPRGNAVARATIVRDLREPVIVLDYDGYLLDLNDRAATMFDWDPTTVAGQALAAIKPELTRLDQSPGATQTVRLTTADGRRQFQYSVSPVGDTPQTGDPIAKAVLLRDVTDQRTREQRLQVLNRVLRHNIRNDIDIMLAHADGIDDPDIRTPIRETARELASLGTKARAAERTMAAMSDPPTTVDLVALFKTVSSEYEADAKAITLTAPDQLTITTHEQVLRTVLEELLDNAVVHATDPPTIAVTLTETTEGVEIRIADDGPGISEHDRAVLAAGKERQLQHVTGLGLWLV